MGSHSLLQGIFLTQGSDLGLPHCRQILCCLSYQGVPYSAIDILVMSSLLPCTPYQNALQIYGNLIPMSYEMLLLRSAISPYPLWTLTAVHLILVFCCCYMSLMMFLLSLRFCSFFFFLLLGSSNHIKNSDILLCPLLIGLSNSRTLIWFFLKNFYLFIDILYLMNTIQSSFPLDF